VVDGHGDIATGKPDIANGTRIRVDAESVLKVPNKSRTGTGVAFIRYDADDGDGGYYVICYILPDLS